MKIQPALRSLLTQDAGDSDVWGWGIGHSFDIAIALYLRGESIPARWQFRPSPVLTEAGAREDSITTSDLLDMLDADEVTADDLRLAGDVLDRYCGFVIRADKNY